MLSFTQKSIPRKGIKFKKKVGVFFHFSAESFLGRLLSLSEPLAGRQSFQSVRLVFSSRLVLKSLGFQVAWFSSRLVLKSLRLHAKGNPNLSFMLFERL